MKIRSRSRASPAAELTFTSGGRWRQRGISSLRAWLLGLIKGPNPNPTPTQRPKKPPGFELNDLRSIVRENYLDDFSSIAAKIGSINLVVRPPQGLEGSSPSASSHGDAA